MKQTPARAILYQRLSARGRFSVKELNAMTHGQLIKAAARAGSDGLFEGSGMKFSTKKARLSAMLDAYVAVRGVMPLQIQSVVGWGLLNELYPIPKRGDDGAVCEAWEKKLQAAASPRPIPSGCAAKPASPVATFHRPAGAEQIERSKTPTRSLRTPAGKTPAPKPKPAQRKSPQRRTK